MALSIDVYRGGAAVEQRHVLQPAQLPQAALLAALVEIVQNLCVCVCVCVCVCARAHVCLRACVRAFVFATGLLCVCERKHSST